MTRLDEIKKRCEAYKWHVDSTKPSCEAIVSEWHYSEDIPYLLSLVEKQAQTIQAIRSLCLDPKEKDGCQTVASQVVRLCDEALEER